MSRKTVLITGGTSGLGRELVRVFLENGWNVGTFGRRSQLVKELKSENGSENLLIQQCDITLSNQIDLFLESLWSRFEHVNLVILNAGALGPTPLKPFRELNLDAFREVYETNLFANVSLIKKLMKHSDMEHTTFVHVTSDAGSTPYATWSPYGSSKAAMDFVIRIINIENQNTGFRAFSFDPGDMNTEMHRQALPDDKPESLRNPAESALELYDIIRKGDYI